jgi:hypothetical protein
VTAVEVSLQFQQLAKLEEISLTRDNTVKDPQKGWRLQISVMITIAKSYELLEIGSNVKDLSFVALKQNRVRLITALTEAIKSLSKSPQSIPHASLFVVRFNSVGVQNDS